MQNANAFEEFELATKNKLRKREEKNRKREQHYRIKQSIKKLMTDAVYFNTAIDTLAAEVPQSLSETAVDANETYFGYQVQLQASRKILGMSRPHPHKAKPSLA